MTEQTTFLVLALCFEETTVSLGNDKTFVVLIGSGDRGNSFYFQSLKVNGELWEQPCVA